MVTRRVGGARAARHHPRDRRLRRHRAADGRSLPAELTLAAANGLYIVLLLLGGMIFPLEPTARPASSDRGRPSRRRPLPGPPRVADLWRLGAGLGLDRARALGDRRASWRHARFVGSDPRPGVRAAGPGGQGPRSGPGDQGLAIRAWRSAARGQWKMSWSVAIATNSSVTYVIDQWKSLIARASDGSFQSARPARGTPPRGRRRKPGTGLPSRPPRRIPAKRPPRARCRRGCAKPSS